MLTPTIRKEAATPRLIGGSPVYVSGEDVLVVTAFNGAAGVTLKFSGRFLPIDPLADDIGRVQPINETFTPATDRTASTKVVGLGEGWILDWQISASAGTPAIGQCYAKVELQRGIASSALVLSRLGRGYVTAKQGPQGPFGVYPDSLEGAGALRSITGTTPAAGAEVLETVPTGARWLLVAFRAQLVTAVAVANRVFALDFDDGANIFARCSAIDVQAASLTERYTVAPSVLQPRAPGGIEQLVPAPAALTLGAGFRMHTSTLNIQAADQYSAVQYLVREWIEGS